MNNLCRSVSKLPAHPAFRIATGKRLFGTQTVRRQSTSTESKEKIVIPARIERGPTDILNALSSTVGYDPTAPHYKYHDDPYLMPMSNVGKKTFAMAQEAGRKAARWIRQENAKLFRVILQD